MKAALLEIGSWLRNETTPVEDVVAKALERLGSEDAIIRRTWSKVALEIKVADWVHFAQMSGLMWQELVAAERYEMFRSLLGKKIVDYWSDWLERRDRTSGSITK